MTLEQVREAIPEAASIESMPVASRTFAKGEVCALGIPVLDLDGDKFQVFFRFDKQGRLYAVRFMAGQVATSVRSFIAIENLLFQKYGRPFERSANGDGDTARFAFWNFPTTTITLRYSYLASLQVESLSLEYSRPSSASDKL